MFFETLSFLLLWSFQPSSLDFLLSFSNSLFSRNNYPRCSKASDFFPLWWFMNNSQMMMFMMWRNKWRISMESASKTEIVEWNFRYQKCNKREENFKTCFGLRFDWFRCVCVCVFVCWSKIGLTIFFFLVNSNKTNNYNLWW